MDLKDVKALITGGSSGIGYAVAKALIEAGGKVAICGRNEEKLNKAASELGATPIVCDVADEAQVAAMIAKTVESLGGYNVLINNAAYGYMSPLPDIDLAKFNELIAANLTGAMLVARESAKVFIPQKSGNIINVASTAGGRGYPNGTPYVASKFALRGMTECWRAELRKHEIRVMLINPSEVQTNFATAAGYPRDFNEKKLVAEDIAHAVPMMLSMNDRGFTTELTVFATNPDG